MSFKETAKNVIVGTGLVAATILCAIGEVITLNEPNHEPEKHLSYYGIMDYVDKSQMSNWIKWRIFEMIEKCDRNRNFYDVYVILRMESYSDYQKVDKIERLLSK